MIFIIKDPKYSPRVHFLQLALLTNFSRARATCTFNCVTRWCYFCLSGPFSSLTARVKVKKCTSERREGNNKHEWREGRGCVTMSTVNASRWHNLSSGNDTCTGQFGARLRLCLRIITRFTFNTNTSDSWDEISCTSFSRKTVNSFLLETL